MSINILPKKKKQSIDVPPSQICNIYLLLATFATKYVIMLNNSHLPLTPLKIIGSSCRYSAALQSFDLVFYVNKGLTLITWDIVITTISIELSDDEKCSSLKCMDRNCCFRSVIISIIVFITKRK